MVSNGMNIAIIPARGGSKRIPRKNIKIFAGKPMISYAIEAARSSALFEKIIVSTDDHEIAEMALKFGAEVPFMRPPELADDFAGTVPVIAHAIKTCLDLGWQIENVCCIYPAVPFIQVADLHGALGLMNNNGANYIFPITEFPSSIQRALKLLNNGRTEPFFPEFELTRTQDSEAAYHDAGQFYWGKAKVWLINQKIHASGMGYVIPNWRIVDIDTPDDWLRAELIYHASKISATTF